MSGPQQHERPANRYAGPAVALAVLGLAVDLFTTFGAVAGVAAVIVSGPALLRAERTDSGFGASMTALVLGLLAIFLGVLFLARGD